MVLVNVVFENIFPKNVRTQVLTTLDRISQPLTDFIRGNPLVSTAAVGIGTTGIVTLASAVARRKKGKKKSRRKKTTRRKTKKTKKRKQPKRKKRRIIRGRGLGRGEIKHSGKGTKGTKRVSFITKDGRRVSFKVKGTSKRRRGFRR